MTFAVNNFNGVIFIENKENCKNTINLHLEKAQKALDEAFENKEFVDEIRSRAFIRFGVDGSDGEHRESPGVIGGPAALRDGGEDLAV